ncbi:MAG: hypothetical protein MUO99_00930, partial [Dehalococcoidales bacterium]|nr:hypothetical protein [Dehalococcoidales bacterium]
EGAKTRSRSNNFPYSLSEGERIGESLLNQGVKEGRSSSYKPFPLPSKGRGKKRGWVDLVKNQGFIFGEGSTK